MSAHTPQGPRFGQAGPAAGTPPVHLRLAEAAALVHARQPAQAARVLRALLAQQPAHPTALHMLADIAVSQGHDRPALDLLNRSLAAAPGQPAVRARRAEVLLRLGDPTAALADVQALLASEPANPDHRVLQARAHEAIGDHATAADVWHALTEAHPRNAGCWLGYGTALRLLGRRGESIAAYRQAIAAEPGCGQAWWALADLKTFRFDDADVAEMERLLNAPGTSAPDRVCLHFALGKACADRADHARAFSHYDQANALHRAGIRHDPAVLSAFVEGCKQALTPEFFSQRTGHGDASTAPVFVVGMMRAGSTLVEQVLASHSQVEGTRELGELAAISRQLEGQAAAQGLSYWQVLAQLTADEAARLGARYLAATAPHRRLGRPVFLDKMGANFTLIGLIQLILPNARIIDVRRHPMACGFSIFSQLFPSGQNDCYSLEDIGRQYHDYVALTAHFDRALPGRVHRVFYEELVASPEREIRRLLDHLGLPFEPACLAFHQTQRVVATVSSEQVRQPIYQSALGHWQHYAPWLGPLADSLGPVLAAYPAVPPAWR
jgi:tetratricopeptide (TPR) repeat protein